MNRYISKSYTRSKNTIYRAGAAVVSTITSNYNNIVWTNKPLVGDDLTSVTYHVFCCKFEKLLILFSCLIIISWEVVRC